MNLGPELEPNIKIHILKIHYKTYQKPLRWKYRNLTQY